MIGDVDPAIPQSLLPGVNASSLLRSEGNTIEVSTVANMAEPSTVVTKENAFEWVKNDKRRMLHVVYRVGDLDKTIKYVCFVKSLLCHWAAVS